MLKWAKGYPAVVVHGPLTAILLMELVRTRAPDRYCLRVSSAGAALRPRPLLPDPHAGRGTHVPGGEGPDGMTTMTTGVDLAGEVPHG